MCRIAGIYYTESSKAAEDWSPTETAQLLFPALRSGGPHAFGWMTWDGEKIEHEKFDGDIAKMANLEKVAVNDDAKWMVLHTRYATHGNTANLHNNHPIVHGDIIGVHNGILSNHEEVLAQVPGGRQYPDASVDSEAIFAAVDTWGHKAGLNAIRGDMAVVYARYSKPEWLYFAKSHGRPLVFARTPAGSLVFASELSILHAVFGYDLTDVRSLRERQLVRVDGGRVADVRQWAPDPPPVIRTRTKPRTNQEVRERWSRHTAERGQARGAAWFDAKARQAVDRLDRAVPVAAEASKRLTKKQRKRARQRELARQEALRDESPEGLYWYQGILVTATELEWLLTDDEREAASQ